MRRSHRLLAENAQRADLLAFLGRAVELAQAIAQLRKQRVVRGLRQVGHIHQMRLPFAASGTDAHEQGLGLERPGGHCGLGADLVAGVDHRIHLLGQQRGPVVLVDEFIDAVHLAMRIDVRDAFTHGLDLGLPDSGVERMDLAVDVGFGHVIEIDQRERRHTTACQCLGRPRAYAADADDGDMRCANARRTFDAIQPGETSKATLQIGVIDGGCPALLLFNVQQLAITSSSTDALWRRLRLPIAGTRGSGLPASCALHVCPSTPLGSWQWTARLREHERDPARWSGST